MLALQGFRGSGQLGCKLHASRALGASAALTAVLAAASCGATACHIAFVRRHRWREVMENGVRRFEVAVPAGHGEYGTIQPMVNTIDHGAGGILATFSRAITVSSSPTGE